MHSSKQDDDKKSEDKDTDSRDESQDSEYKPVPPDPPLGSGYGVVLSNSGVPHVSTNAGDYNFTNPNTSGNANANTSEKDDKNAVILDDEDGEYWKEWDKVKPISDVVEEELEKQGFKRNTDIADASGITGRVEIRTCSDNKIASNNQIAIKFPKPDIMEILSYYERDINIYKNGYKLDLLTNKPEINRDHRTFYIDTSHKDGIKFNCIDKSGWIQSGTIKWEGLNLSADDFSEKMTNEQTLQKLQKHFPEILKILRNKDLNLFDGFSNVDDHDKNELISNLNERKMIRVLQENAASLSRIPKTGLLKIGDLNIVVNECIFSDKEMKKTKTLDSHMLQLGQNYFDERPVPVSVMCVLNVSRPLRSTKDGINELHEKGIGHHDIAGRNLMFTPDGTVKIIDFGIATKMNANTPGKTLASVLETSLKLPYVNYNNDSILSTNGIREFSYKTDLFSFRILNTQALGLFMGEKDVAYNITLRNLKYNNSENTITKNDYLKGIANELSQIDEKSRLGNPLENLTKYANDSEYQKSLPKLPQHDEDGKEINMLERKSELVNHYINLYKPYLSEISSEKNLEKLRQDDNKQYYKCSANEITIALQDLNKNINLFMPDEIDTVVNEASERGKKCLELGLYTDAKNIAIELKKIIALKEIGEMKEDLQAKTNPFISESKPLSEQIAHRREQVQSMRQGNIKNEQKDLLVFKNRELYSLRLLAKELENDNTLGKEEKDNKMGELYKQFKKIDQEIKDIIKPADSKNEKPPKKDEENRPRNPRM